MCSEQVSSSQSPGELSTHGSDYCLGIQPIGLGSLLPFPLLLLALPRFFEPCYVSPRVWKLRSPHQICRSLQRSPLAYSNSPTFSLCNSLVSIPSICCHTSLLLFLERNVCTTARSLPFPLPCAKIFFEVSRTDRLGVQEVQEDIVSRSY